MVRPIVKDPVFLSQPSDLATPEDLSVGQDLLDTLAAYADTCVGMAANMIGVAKRIVVFNNEGTPTLLFNPKILKQSGPYRAEEGCAFLSPAGGKPNGTSLSRWSTRTKPSKPAGKPSRASLPRSSSTRLTTATAFSYNEKTSRPGTHRVSGRDACQGNQKRMYQKKRRRKARACVSEKRTRPDPPPPRCPAQCAAAAGRKGRTSSLYRHRTGSGSPVAGSLPYGLCRFPGPGTLWPGEGFVPPCIFRIPSAGYQYHQFLIKLL